MSEQLKTDLSKIDSKIDPTKTGEIEPEGNIIRLAETDALFPKHWKSGAMKYERFEPFAMGGTAELSTCFDTNLQRSVVFKTLHPHLRDSDTETRRFLREARVTAIISHPGTVPLYELGRDGRGALYFTMKRLQGRDLRSILIDLVEKNNDVLERFSILRMIDILVSVCQTVAHANMQGVIHRDLKPANILVGAFGEVTVLDWGLAKVQGEDIDSEEELERNTAQLLELTVPGKRYGTPLYMSPEQATASPDLDGRSDVYNLGSVLFEMLTLKSLIWGETVDEVMEKILHRPVPSPRQVAPERNIPPELEAICLKALAREPKDRYQSVEALLHDLYRFRNGEKVSVYSYSPFHYWLKWRTGHTLLLTAALSALVGAGAVFVWIASR